MIPAHLAIETKTGGPRETAVNPHHACRIELPIRRELPALSAPNRACRMACPVARYFQPAGYGGAARRDEENEIQTPKPVGKTASPAPDGADSKPEQNKKRRRTNRVANPEVYRQF